MNSCQVFSNGHTRNSWPLAPWANQEVLNHGCILHTWRSLHLTSGPGDLTIKLTRKKVANIWVDHFPPRCQIKNVSFHFFFHLWQFFPVSYTWESTLCLAQAWKVRASQTTAKVGNLASKQLLDLPWYWWFYNFAHPKLLPDFQCISFSVDNLAFFIVSESLALGMHFFLSG